MRPGRRKRKARALQAAQVCNMVEPQITAGLRVPVGGWWTTRGGAWAKGERGRRYRLFDVAGARSALAQERATLARIHEYWQRWERSGPEVAR